MQCYERKAMYLKLYADLAIEMPRLEYDPILLDQILYEFEIDRFNTLSALDPRKRREILARLKLLTDEVEPWAVSDCLHQGDFLEYPLASWMIEV
jgi:hypothetical protein